MCLSCTAQTDGRSCMLWVSSLVKHVFLSAGIGQHLVHTDLLNENSPQ